MSGFDPSQRSNEQHGVDQATNPVTSYELPYRTNELAPQGNMLYLLLLTLVAALGGLLFGYDTAVISGAIGFLQERFDLDTGMKGWAAACALVGCMIGASVAGFIGDRFGRKKAMVLAAVLFVVSAIGSAVPRNLHEFVVARMLGGVGIGIAAMLSPLYISEVAPARMRGQLVSVNQFAIIFGMLVVYFANAVIASQGDKAWNIALGWRWMFASEILPAAVFLVLLAVVPESPRWLTKKGRTAAAEQILARIGGAEHARAEIAEIEDALAHERQESLAQLLEPAMRVPLLIGVGLAILQQITGINVVLYYAPEIFKSAGVATQQSINDTVIVGAVNLVFTLVAIGIVDRLGRKPLLLIASAGMGGSLAALGVAFARQDFSGPWVLRFVLIYVASFAVAMGPVVWVVLAEIFPTRIRGRAMSVATVCLWLACFAVTQFFPAMLETLKGAVFFVYAGICVIAFLFVARFVPETKGKSLEEIERQWFQPAEPTESSDG